MLVISSGEFRQNQKKLLAAKFKTAAAIAACESELALHRKAYAEAEASRTYHSSKALGNLRLADGVLTIRRHDGLLKRMAHELWAAAKVEA